MAASTLKSRRDVMAGLDPATPIGRVAPVGDEVPGSSPGMTE